MTHIMPYSESFIETLDSGCDKKGQQVLLDRHENAEGETRYCVKVGNTPEAWYVNAGEARVHFNSITI